MFKGEEKNLIDGGSVECNLAFSSDMALNTSNPSTPSKSSTPPNSSTPSPASTLNGPTHSHKKPIRLKNYQQGTECYDTLHLTAHQMYPTQCTDRKCLGSIMYPGQFKNSCQRSPEDILLLAADFFNQYFTSIKRANTAPHQARWEQVMREVNNHGTYELTETELVYGAKLAWRNASRCIGRIQWSKLQVFDCRSVTTTSNMFEAICNHIKYSTNKGNIRSAITIFAQRTDCLHDFRVWNPQMISYAGYQRADGSILGDPSTIEFTEVCMKLGWKGKGTQFDILPLVLQANGQDPDYFDLPPELVLEVEFSHPQYPWFEELGLKWYAVPGVSNMLFECGGLQFTACPFNGWYMSSEIACRDLCDPHRYNVLEKVALRMGLNTKSHSSLWKDRALVEVNLAVLHSFQSRKITIMDHHTAAETFMKHYENELRLRNGCPADWVWIVPPISGSITPVFHQEMVNYQIQPCYDYQDAAWKVFEWNKREQSGLPRNIRKFHFKQIARAVKLTSKLFGQALSKRIKVTILYATETGKSEGYAKKLGEIFSHAFHSKVIRMDEYDPIGSGIEHEAILLVVTSTFGNGDPPENGRVFAEVLQQMIEDSRKEDFPPCPGSYMRSNSSPPPAVLENCHPFLDINRLANVGFAVFSLGSSAYPNFCAFGKTIDKLLKTLGGNRLLEVCCGDELCGQDASFRKWLAAVFRRSCEEFSLECEEIFPEIDDMIHDVKTSSSTVRLFSVSKEDDHLTGLTKCHNRRLFKFTMGEKKNLHATNKVVTVVTDKAKTLLLELVTEGNPYEPGDHVGVFPCNRKEMVDGIIKHLNEAYPDQPVQLQLLKERPTPNGVEHVWTPHEKLPRCSLRTLLTRYMDITTPLGPCELRVLASFCQDSYEQRELDTLSSDDAKYEDWKHSKYPNLLEIFEMFPSCKPPPAMLISLLPLLQPRFYSISSSPLKHFYSVYLTVAVVTYKTEDGKLHYGVCSNYLQDVPRNEEVYAFIRSAHNFHLPTDLTKPMIVVGPGTGIAPFRSFWQHRAELKKMKAVPELGPMILFFGCRYKQLDLYYDEKKKMIEDKVLDEAHLALSREPNLHKVYVQDLMKIESAKIYKLIYEEEGHFYVCGDCKMAEDVSTTLRSIIQDRTFKGKPEMDEYFAKMRSENRYHEDIFGITLRTAEVHSQSRVTARNRMASESIP